MSVGQQDAFTQEIGVGPAVHLSLEHLDAIDVAFDLPGTVGQGQPGFDGVEVTAEPGDERKQFGQVIGSDRLHPPFEIATATLQHHTCEAADMITGGGQ